MPFDTVPLARTSISDIDGGEDGCEDVRYSQLQHDYQKLEARVWALAKTEYQIVDSKITKKYRSIRDGINDWIDTFDGKERGDFKDNYQRHRLGPQRERMFEDLGFESAFIGEQWLKELGRLETCIYVVLGLVVAKHLKALFRRSYPLGINDHQKSFIDSMINVLHPNDSAMFYRWRGETISGLTKNAEFAQRCNDDTDRLLRRLTTELMKWIDLRPTKADISLREHVLEPAVDFHRMINCSGKKFKLQYWNNETQEVRLGGDLMDIASWTVTRKKDSRTALQCFLPGLVMEKSLDQTEIELAPPVLLSYVPGRLDPSRSERSSPERLDPMVRDTASLDTRHKQNSGRRTPQTHGSRRSTSKSNKPESLTLLQSLTSKWRGDGASSRKNSLTQHPQSPAGYSARQHSTDSARHGRASSVERQNRLETETSFVSEVMEQLDEEQCRNYPTSVDDDSLMEGQYGSDTNVPKINTTATITNYNSDIYAKEEQLREQSGVDPNHPSIDRYERALVP